jgi:hypothetical protein
MPLHVIITAANTVSAWRSPNPGQHQRHDQRDLDHRHGDRENERAERLADAVGDDLGMMDRGEHRARQEQSRAIRLLGPCFPRFEGLRTAHGDGALCSVSVTLPTAVQRQLNGAGRLNRL